MPDIKHFAPPSGVKSPPLSFAARTGDLLFISGIPGFDENGALAEGFEAQFGYVSPISSASWTSRRDAFATWSSSTCC